MDSEDPTRKLKSSQKFFSGLDDALQGEQDRLSERQALLDKQNDGSLPGSDKMLPANQQHSYEEDKTGWKRKRNFDEKIYLFPESYNALRKELHEYWPNVFNGVNPNTGVSIAYYMAFDGLQFIAMMNDVLDMTEQMDSDNVSNICKAYLNKLWEMRGISRRV